MPLGWELCRVGSTDHPLWESLWLVSERPWSVRRGCGLSCSKHKHTERDVGVNNKHTHGKQ